MLRDIHGESVGPYGIPLVRCLDPAGKAVGPLPDIAAEPDALAALYRAMVLTRIFDEKAVALQRTGRLGTYASSLGQEAVSVGAGAAMRPGDVFLPSFREQGGQIVRGVTLVELLQYWGGDERGSDFAGPREDFPICIPVASNLPHACGVALGLKLRGRSRAALAVLGDGATSKGDFYEAINIAGVWALPVVFLIDNNQWAISVAREQQSAAQTLAQKGIAAGIDCIQVDGNDVLAVRWVCEAALTQARADGRPALIEALSYRMGDHTTADDASRYRADSEVSPHWKEDPIARLRQFMVAAGMWTNMDEETVQQTCRVQVDAAAQMYLALPPQAPESLFDHLYERLPEPLIPQRDEAIARWRRHG